MMRARHARKALAYRGTIADDEAFPCSGEAALESVMRRAVIAFAACVVAAGGASAQEVYVDETYDDDADTYVEAPAYVDEPVVVEEVAPATEGIIVGGPRVYGWTALRPVNCGTFRYWNGEYCADARFDPPDE
jgi:hypothetical protein